MAEAIRNEYMTRQKKRAEAVVRAVRDRCRQGGVKPPAANTARARVRRVRADLAARAREGTDSAAARPMAVLQVDHTPVDRKREPTPTFRCGPELTRFAALVGGVCADVGERGLIRGA